MSPDDYGSQYAYGWRRAGKRVVAVDPGVHMLGIGVFTDSVLEHASLMKAENQKLQGPEAWVALARLFAMKFQGPMTVVMEFPRVYQGGKQGGDPADMLELAAVDGALCAAVAGTDVKLVRVFPSDWKKQMDKETTTPRILQRLQEAGRNEEKMIEMAGAKSHNILDAIGVGLYYLGRFEKRRVYAR